MKERWWFGPNAREVIGARLDLSVAGWMEAAAAGEILSTDRDSAAVRLETGKGPVLVKWRAVRPEQRWRWWLRPSRERCEARGLELAAACEVGVPEPLAVGERRDGFGRLVGSVLIRVFLDGLVPADVVLRDDAGGHALASLAFSLSTWHGGGFRHGDCWPKNILGRREESTFWVPIGAPRASRRPVGWEVDRARLMDVARLEAGVRLLRRDYTPFRLLEHYVLATHLPPATELRRRLEPLVGRVLARRAADERTRPLREPHGPPKPVPLPPDPRPVRRRESALE